MTCGPVRCAARLDSEHELRQLRRQLVSAVGTMETVVRWLERCQDDRAADAVHLLRRRLEALQQS